MRARTSDDNFIHCRAAVGVKAMDFIPNKYRILRYLGQSHKLRSMRRLWLLIVLMALALHVPAAFAVQPDEVLSDPSLEQRARALSKELRCMVCQNQSIDDSDAPLARDLRIL